MGWRGKIYGLGVLDRNDSRCPFPIRRVTQVNRLNCTFDARLHVSIDLGLFLESRTDFNDHQNHFDMAQGPVAQAG